MADICQSETDVSGTSRESWNKGLLTANAALCKLRANKLFTQRERKSLDVGLEIYRQPSNYRNRAFQAFLQPIFRSAPWVALLCLIKLGHSRLGKMAEQERTRLQTSLLNDTSAFDNEALRQKIRGLGTYEKIINDEASTGSVMMTTSKTHILFLGIPEGGDDIANSDMLGIPVDLQDLGILNKHLYTLLTPEKINDLQDHLGPSFISQRGNKLVIHQAVLTILYACQSPTVTADFRTWAMLQDLNERDQLVERIQAMPQTKMLVFVSCTNSSWHNPGSEDFYRYMDLIEATHGNVVVHPSETELKWEELKIGDVRVFDEIAQSNQKFTYRPKTCLGIGECTLPEVCARHVIKRSYSCGGAHVRVARANSRPGLRCQLRTTAPTSMRAGPRPTNSASSKHVWFHQELVDSLGRFGEFRVWLVQGKAFKAAHTRFDHDFNSKSARESKVFAVTPVDLSSFDWYSNDPAEQQSKWDELYEFAEMVNSCLRNRHDAVRHYQSVQVGLRLDIGVSEQSSRGVFFVNEATRFYCADYMSELICQPFTEISMALGRAIAQKCEDGEWWLR